jgi:putative intracellular protease/amidase
VAAWREDSLKSVALLVFDGFADWEPAFVLAGLRRWGGKTVAVVGYDRDPVTSMGGLCVVPNRTLGELTAAETEVLILPGGDAWATGYPAATLDPVLAVMQEARVPIAVICGATIAAARAGLFRGRRHTSNGRSFLQAHAPGYDDTAQYEEGTLAVTDDGVISASGLGAIEFAREIFAALGVLSPDDLRLYITMYRGGRPPAP